MSLRLATLPPDTLQIIAEYIARRGETFWFKLACRAFRTATEAARVALQCAVLATPVSSVFTSIARVRYGLPIARVAAIVEARRDAIGGTDSRPRSLDGRHVWSPLGERAIARRATPEVLDYVWANWVTSTCTVNPGCFLTLASRHGRVDLLKHMDQGAEQLRIYSKDQHKTLRIVLNRAVDNSGTCLRQVASGIIVPSLKCGDASVFRWYYQRQESAEALSDTYFAGSDVAWRRQFTHSDDGLRILAEAAASSDDPQFSLTFLCREVWPAVGDRSPHRQLDARIQIGGVALTRIVCHRWTTMLGAWLWLKQAWCHTTSGIVSLLTALQEFPQKFQPSELYQNLFRAPQADVYQWMAGEIDDGGWFGDIFTNYGDMLWSRESLDYRNHNASRRLSFALATLAAVYNKYLANNDEFGAIEKELAVAALTDALLWSWERPKIVGKAGAGAGVRVYPDSDEETEASKEWLRVWKADTYKYVVWLCGSDTCEAPLEMVEVLLNLYRRQDELGPARGYVVRGVTELAVPRIMSHVGYSAEIKAKLEAVGVDMNARGRGGVGHPAKRHKTKAGRSR